MLSTTSPARVSLNDVTMSFGDRIVTNAITIDVPAGKVLSIVGPSGCGKTTLLRSIAGLLTPASGEVLLDSSPVHGTPQGLAMVFQQFGLFPWKTVEANIAYGLRTRGMSARDAVAEIKDLVDLVGLAPFAKSYPHQLSGGMQQRAGLARALAVRPRVLLMDEPFGALDAQTREVLQYEMLRLREEYSATMIFVTHSIDEAVLFGDRVAVLGGRPSTVMEMIEVDLTKPRDRAVSRSAGFLDLREHIWSLVMGNEGERSEKEAARSAHDTAIEEEPINSTKGGNRP
jgi:NitT/TauT family transport system ATP-binding protein